MSRRSSNLIDLNNQELQQLRKGAKTSTGVILRVGSKKYKLPIEVLTLTTDKKGLFTFLSFPGANVIVGSTSTGSEVIRPEKKSMAMKSLRGTIARANRGPAMKKRAAIEPTQEVVNALAQLAAWSKANNVKVISDPTQPSGYRVRSIRGKRTKA